MPTPMISENWPRFIYPVIRKEWLQQLAAIASSAMQMFGVQKSNDSVEFSQGIGNFGEVPEYNSSDAEGNPAAIPYDSISPLFETTFTHKEYVKGVAIERKLIDDNRTGTIKRKVQALGHAFGTTRAIHASSIFNNAFADVLGGDGVVLCSASHPTNKVDTTAVSNLGTSALDNSSVIATLLAGMNQLSDRGTPMPAIFNVLYVPTALEEAAWTIVSSLKKSGTADNDGNYVGSKGLNVVVDPYLSDSNNWFMLDASLAKMHMLWFDRVKPEIAMDLMSDFNIVARYRGYMRHSFGWDDHRFIYGHNVT